jgi:hypothetical protein
MTARYSADRKRDEIVAVLSFIFFLPYIVFVGTLISDLNQRL